MRYYFHVRKGEKLFRNRGGEFKSPEAARADAEQAAREMLAERMLRGQHECRAFVITIEDGGAMSRLPFRAVLNLDRWNFPAEE